MLQWFHTLTDLEVAVVFAAATTGTVILLPRLMRRVLRLAPDSDAADYAVRGQGTLITACIFVLGFSLVQAQQAFHRVQNQAGTEAALVNQLDRLLVRYNDSTTLVDIRVKLRTYAHSIVAEEWPAMRQGKSSPVTRNLFGPVSRAILAVEPGPGRQLAVYTDMLKRADDLAEAREARLESANSALPAVFWQAIIFLLLLMAMLTCLIEQTPTRSIALSAQVLAVTALMALVFITDYPFRGESAIQPDDMLKAISIIEARTL